MGLEDFRTQAREMVSNARRLTLSMMPPGLPEAAETPGQEALRAKHGTPAEFAAACVKAVGEISINEAVAAVERYLSEWRAA